MAIRLPERHQHQVLDQERIVVCPWHRQRAWTLPSPGGRGRPCRVPESRTRAPDELPLWSAEPITLTASRVTAIGTAGATRIATDGRRREEGLPMDLELTGKVVIVTGAAAGIGQECARLLVAEGATVVGVDRDALPMEDVGDRLSGVQADLTDPAAAKRVVDEVVARHSRLHGLGCNPVS